MNPSDIFDGRYRLVRLAGGGGMAEVWLAEDLRLGRPVALKILRERISREHDGDLVSALEREARVVARLQHPNIVSVYDAGQSGGRNFLAMEFVDGQSLRQVLNSRGRLGQQQAVTVGIQVAEALEYAHSQGVVHNDVKPENILVTDRGVAKVTDFGVAETVTRTLSPDEARDLLGTIAYLAPEVIQGSPPDQRSDVYSLALTIYELVSGRPPFGGVSAAAMAGQRLAAPAPPVRTYAPEVSAELEQVLARALSFLPADRFQTAADFGRALAAVRATPPVVGSPPPPSPPAARAAQQRPAATRYDTPTLVRRGGPPPPNRGSNAAAITAVVAAILIALGAGAVLGFALLGDGDGDDDGEPTTTPAATPTEEPTESPTDEPSVTPTPTETATPTREPSETPTRRPSPTATGQPATETPRPSETPTP